MPSNTTLSLPARMTSMIEVQAVQMARAHVASFLEVGHMS